MIGQPFGKTVLAAGALLALVDLSAHVASRLDTLSLDLSALDLSVLSAAYLFIIAGIPLLFGLLFVLLTPRGEPPSSYAVLLAVMLERSAFAMARDSLLPGFYAVAAGSFLQAFAAAGAALTGAEIGCWIRRQSQNSGHSTNR